MEKELSEKEKFDRHNAEVIRLVNEHNRIVKEEQEQKELEWLVNGKEARAMMQAEYDKAYQRNSQSFQQEYTQSSKLGNPRRVIAAILAIVAAITVYTASRDKNQEVEPNFKEPVGITQTITKDETISNNIVITEEDQVNIIDFLNQQNNNIGAIAKLKKNSDISDQLEDLRKECGSIVAKNTHRAQDPQYLWYDTYDIARGILNYEGKYDIHSVIFASYNKINFSVIKQMDEIFRNMKMLIEFAPENFSEEVRNACSYGSFQEYLDAHKITSYDEYKEIMREIVYTYHENSPIKTDELLKYLVPEADPALAMNFGGETR